ncbi:hypothetical protein LguiB_009328 [Lonicera macranthoides]
MKPSPSKVSRASSSSTPSSSSSHPFQFSELEKVLEPMEAISLLPEELQETVVQEAIHLRAKDQVQVYLNLLLRTHGLVFRGLRLHPHYPFCSLFHIHYFYRVPKEALVFLWYLTTVYHVGFIMNAPDLLLYLQVATADPEFHHLYMHLYGVASSYSFITFLKWFKTLDQWMDALKTHFGTYCLIHFHNPQRFPSPEGSSATVEAWFSENLAKSIKEPYNLNYDTFLRNICALNKVDYDSVPMHVKFDRDPWQKTTWEICGSLFESVFKFAISHRMDFGELSSDSEAYVQMDTDEDEDDGHDPNAGNVAQELADLANTSAEDEPEQLIQDEPDSPYSAPGSPWHNHSPDSPNTPIYGGNDIFDDDASSSSTITPNTSFRSSESFRSRSVPPTSQISASTNPSTQPTAYSQTPEAPKGDSTKPQDLFMLEAFESQPKNQIGSFLKALAYSDREPVQTQNEDLFQAFEQLYAAIGTSNPQQPQQENEPMVEDPPAPQEVPLNNPPPPASNHAHDNHVRFTLDDIKPNLWRDRFFEFKAWMIADNELFDLKSVYKRFLARITGRLHDWYESLREYRQLQLQQCPHINAFLGTIYNEFVGTPDKFEEIAKEEFLGMKCCSLKDKDLERHYDRMSKRFYLIGGIDDANLKQVFFQSFPDALVTEATKSLKLQKLEVKNLSLGRIYEHLIDSIERICNHKKLVEDMEKTQKMLKSACNKDHWKIKCKNKEGCDCSQHKKAYKKKKKYKSTSRKQDSFVKPYKKQKKFKKKKFKFVQKRTFRGKKSDKCFLCKKPGHFAKNCPDANKRTQFMKLLHQLAPDIAESDVESVLSAQDEAQPGCLMQLAITDSEASDIEENESGYSDTPLSNGDVTEESSACLQLALPTEELLLIDAPHARVKLFTEAYAKPISVIALFDTGSTRTLINPSLLPSNIWKPCPRIAFRVANGNIMYVDTITKPILIQLFPGVRVKHAIYGSSLTQKELMVGWDLIRKMNAHFSDDGLRYKKQFLPWHDPENALAVYQTSPAYPIDPGITLEILQKNISTMSCAESHTEFLTKCQNPLWRNSKFFVTLPFKLNEDANPTRASHSGMNPEHQSLALQELATLRQQQLIEDTNSPWACEAFYVNKRAEQVRGKLRLVINYQPLNYFLASDKFPLPQKQSLFSHLSHANVFSKFDLKAGFWQLGITPADRPKTAFCIPGFHYQWTVMPFGLKNAPSVFQKTMMTIFEPIAANALIYIDDILLFSQTHEEHLKLLHHFHHIVLTHGIMLSERKMVIGKTEIEFLGMIIKNGKFQLQPHISRDLQSFPDKLTSKTQIQQFLGLVNYMSQFIPKVSKHTAPLTALLKKSPPQWSEAQTAAVKALKALTSQLPNLQIPSDGQRILQTDASNEFWAAILLEEKNGVRTPCGYKSGKFKQGELHYHSTYKEILAVKRGIEKFQFHLIGYHIKIEMDMSSFPAMIQFKNKQIPQSQLLRWSEWFSQWDYEVKHIQGKNNVIADFFLRKQSLPEKQNALSLKHNALSSHIDPVLEEPFCKPFKFNDSQAHLSSHSLSAYCIPIVYTLTEMKPSPSKVSRASSSSTPSSSSSHPFQFSELEKVLEPMEAISLLPEELQETVVQEAIHLRAKDQVQVYLNLLLRTHGLVFRGLRLHPHYPFCSLFHIHYFYRVPKEALVFLWYLTTVYHVGFIMNAPDLLLYLQVATADPEFHHPYMHLYGVASSYNFITFLKWFKTLDQWMDALKTHFGTYCLIHFHNPQRFPSPEGSSATVEAWFSENLAKSIKEPYNLNYVTFLRNICALNKVDYDSVPMHVKFDRDPWQKTTWEICGSLFESVFKFAISHRMDFGELSSDSEAYVQMDTDEDEDDGHDPNAGNVAQELADLANTSAEDEPEQLIQDEPDSPYSAPGSPWHNHSPDSPNTPIYGGNDIFDDDGNETD